MPKENKKVSLSLQKIFTISGLLLIALSIVATIFMFILSPPYIYSTLDLLLYAYYGRFILTIIGGFAVGLLFAYLSGRRRSKKQDKGGLLFTATSFGLLTSLVFYQIDLLRLPVREIFGDFAYPWAKIEFLGLPLAALALVALVTFIAFMMKANISASTKWFQRTFIAAFALQQVGIFLTASFISSGAEASFTALIIGLFGFLTTPLVIAIATYFLLSKLKDTLLRLFSATVVGTLYFTLTLLLWEFRINPEAHASLIFGNVVLVITLSSVGALVIALRHAISQKH